MDKLPPREKEVLGLIADGLSNPEIAQKLFITIGTVKCYIRRILSTLNLTRYQAIA